MRPGLDMASIYIEVWTSRPVQIDRGALTPPTPLPDRVLLECRRWICASRLLYGQEICSAVSTVERYVDRLN